MAELGTGRFAALFGYESTSGAPLVVPAGPTNHIEPSSPLPDAQPPVTFDPGRHVTAFWAPLDQGTGAVDWVVGGSHAHATLESPPCTATAFPSHDPSIAEPRGETHAPPAPSTPTPASYFFIQPPTPPMMTSRAAISAGQLSSPGPVTQDLIPQFAPLFEVTLTYLTLGTDGCFASRDVDAELYIGGVYAGRKHVYDDGCVFCVDTCIYPNPTLNVTFQMNVSPNTPTVPVRIRLLEHDSGSPDDVVMDKTFNVDNHFGQPNEVCDGGSDGWATCFTAKQTGLPPDLVEPRVCATFKAAFMDSDLGEDDPGVAVPGATYREYPASFAFAWVGVDGPLGSSSVAVYLDADGCVPPGQIPKENFAFIPGVPPGDEGSLKMDVLFNTNNGSGGFKRPDGVHYYLTSKRFETSLYGATTHEGDVPLSSWTDWGVWKVPPGRIDMHVPVLSPVTNIASVISTMLTRNDIGFSLDDPATTGVDESEYSVEQGGRGCTFVDLFGRNYCESWGSSDLFSVGYALPRPDAPACRQDSECTGGTLCYEADCSGLPPGADCRPGGFDSQGLFLDFGGTDKPCTASSATCFCAQTDDSRWKFVIAHEAGHQIEERGIGHLPDAFYTFSCPPNTTCTGRRGEVVGAGDSLSDPPLVPEEAPFCSCKYVTVANSLHCLQSIERVGAAQAEGFGQFFASRAWNRQDDGDCRFGYYKEFLGHSCVVGGACPQVDAAGQPGFINAPPVPVDCASAVKWRNHNCPIDGRMGTEFDWMGLLYNLNSVGALRTSMQDIFNIYRQACLQLAAPGSAAGPNPPRCVLRDQESLDVGWESEPPILDAPSSGTSCLVDADCKGTETCRDISEPGGLAPCAGTSCVCKNVQACTADTDCVTGTSCRDDASGSPAPCTDGTCVCKLSKACTTDADCSIYGHQHCRDDSVGFPPCTDASCVCIAFPQAGFLDGAKVQYAGDQARVNSITDLGRNFGVNRDLSP
ncbi:MAG TPA: hypothetical protein VFV94_11805 [Polyangiaceae bacterium]|nr:hypothetical protein [Polyangiaceae bacterium]